MATKAELEDWVLAALRLLGGKARIVPVCKVIWERHEAELRASGDLFYTWQYDVRWAAQYMRGSGELKPLEKPGVWELAD